MYNARVTTRDADGNAQRRWLKDEVEFRDVLRGEFGLNLSDNEIRQCIEVMERKGTGDAPHPFFG
jgi:N-hydroxyarylamine O-acetyltransferase